MKRTLIVTFLSFIVTGCMAWYPYNASALDLLSLSSPTVQVPFSGVKLDGQPQTDTATLSNITVTDVVSLLSNGWHLSVQASRFSEVGGSGSVRLPSGSLWMTPFSGISEDGVIIGSQQVTTQLPCFIDTGSAVTALSTSGSLELIGLLNTWTLASPTLVLKLTPATARVDASLGKQPTLYTSTITWTIASGP